MGVGKSTISKWVKQLHEERAGKAPKSMPMTLMSDSLNSSR